MACSRCDYSAGNWHWNRRKCTLFQTSGRKEEEEASAVFYVTITSLLVFGILTGMILCVIGRPLLQILGAGGVVYSHAWKYVQVISAGAVFQVLGAGLIPILRNRHRAYEAMVA